MVICNARSSVRWCISLGGLSKPFLGKIINIYNHMSVQLLVINKTFFYVLSKYYRVDPLGQSDCSIWCNGFWVLRINDFQIDELSMVPVKHRM